MRIPLGKGALDKDAVEQRFLLGIASPLNGLRQIVVTELGKRTYVWYILVPRTGRITGSDCSTVSCRAIGCRSMQIRASAAGDL
jgi:hypothetical protein